VAPLFEEVDEELLLASALDSDVVEEVLSPLDSLLELDGVFDEPEGRLSVL
jgi:hypothetical protein